MNRLDTPRKYDLEQLPPANEAKTNPGKRRRMRWAWVWLLVLGLAGYLGFRAYRANQQKQQAASAAQAARQAKQPISVAAAQARRGDIPVYLRGLGTVTAYNTVNVKPRVDGPIVAINFQEGQHVKQGESLLKIDPRPYQVALEQAKGQLARDEAQLKDAQTDLARYQTLWQEQVIPRQQLDTQVATVGQVQGTIQADQAAIHNADLNLSFTDVTAPIGGRIGLRLVDIGNIVHAADTNPLLVITQTQPIAVIFTIPADSLPPVLAKLRAGAQLPVYAYDRADVNKLAAGTLETVDNTIDVTTGTSRLKSIFTNTDESLFPNQFVNCRLLLDTKRGVVLIPAPAVQHGPQGAYVYVVNADKKVTMRPVTTGTSEGNQVEVTSGIAAGDTVVTDGQDKLQPGSPVQIRPDSAGSNANTPSTDATFNGPPNRDITGTAQGTGTPTGAGNYTGNPNFTGTSNAGGARGGRAEVEGSRRTQGGAPKQ
ncbi:MAG: MdtA/MuxA family multidrug efflux RND transporter periplasmic adaptor subunit [Acidobacteriia bacterium]|nr:MdtA/MuxA family multidrug efflux RND transporter periplasmic adaptor subunit [Terriglobia bacterium]